MTVHVLKSKGRTKKILLWTLWGWFAWTFSLLSCASSAGKEAVTIPFLKMEPGECYFIDEFLPTPSSLVSGKNNNLFLRYYTYNLASYKIWVKEKVMLAFYSKDNRCWSLFEEYNEKNEKRN